MDAGTEKYTGLQECVTKLLQVQADYESVRSGAYPEGEYSTKLQINY